MPNSGRRKLLTMMGAGALASGMGSAAEPGSPLAQAPRALVNTIRVRLKKTPAGATLFAVDFGGSLDAGHYLHTICGQVDFAHQPTEVELARAVKKALIRQVAQSPGTSLRARDITVVSPTFL